VGLLGAGAFFAVGLLGLGRPLVAWFFNALGGFLIQASSVLDGVDGEIARLKHQSSPYGAYFEYMLDRYVDGLAVSGMIYSAYVLSGNFTIILVGFLALIGLPLSSIHRAKFLAEAGRPYLAEYDGLLRFLPYSRDVRLLVIALGGVLNRVELALYFLAIVPNLVTLLRFYTVRRALER
jgi:CDP-L-myo-inositol myo-inositolphosphotransferase